MVGEVYRGGVELTALIARAGLRDRVVVHPGYLPAERIPELFAGVDALVLPYRTATASQLVALAHEHGLPTVATRVGNFPDVVTDGVDGLLCAPGDVDDLERALRQLYRPGRLVALRSGVRPADPDPVWRTTWPRCCPPRPPAPPRPELPADRRVSGSAAGRSPARPPTAPSPVLPISPAGSQTGKSGSAVASTSPWFSR